MTCSHGSDGITVVPSLTLRTGALGQGAAVPTGAILDYAGATAPEGFLACDGAAVSRTTHARLYAAIGDTWGAGDGSTTFNVPDLRRRVRIGSGGSGTPTIGADVGDAGGSETHTLTAAEIPSHTHAAGALKTVAAGTHRHELAQFDTSRSSTGVRRRIIDIHLDTRVSDDPPMGEAGSHTHTVAGTTGAAGSGSAHSIMQPAAVVAAIIKT